MRVGETERGEGERGRGAERGSESGSGRVVQLYEAL